MKPLEKIIRGLIKIFVFGTLILLILISLFIFYATGSRKAHIQTEYGDSFIIKEFYFDSDGYLEDDDSSFSIYFESLKSEDIKPVCDTENFRCYHVQNADEDFYFGKIKPDGSFFYVTISDAINAKQNPEEETFSHAREEIAESRVFCQTVKKQFLSDEYLIKFFTPHMLEVYSEEMETVCNQFIEGNYENLEQYGLTANMIQNQEELKQKHQTLLKAMNVWRMYKAQHTNPAKPDYNHAMYSAYEDYLEVLP